VSPAEAKLNPEEMPMRLGGKVALVTGAQQGIGRAIALALARDGADVGINYLDDRVAAEAVAAEARGLGRRAVVVPADVSRAAEVDAMLTTVTRELGVPDILVNNAGVFPRVPFLDLTERDWDHVLDVNLKGSFLCAQASARVMVAGGRRGAIVSLSSVAIRGVPLGVHYAASKAGLLGLTRAMALALAPYGIRVNAVAPGLTDTAQPRHRNTDAELFEMARVTIPLGGRMAEPDEIASVVVFLASEEARFVTGQLVHVNGGSFMG
jgi:NAD(P)-dependent dehydrogenase (short-subunit alcohol dehydrogenase family)